MHLADLLGVGLTEGATEHSEVLTEHKHLQNERQMRCKILGKDEKKFQQAAIVEERVGLSHQP